MTNETFLTTNDAVFSMPAFNRNVCEAHCQLCAWWHVGLAWETIRRAQDHAREHSTIEVTA